MSGASLLGARENGKSHARITDGKIELLVDSYDDQEGAEAAAWMNETGVRLDPSYA